MFIDRAEERPAERTVSCISQVFACYEDDKYYYTLLESLHGGDLFDFFRVLTTSDSLEPEDVENEVRKVISNLLESLHHLHSQGLIHKDVRLAVKQAA